MADRSQDANSTVPILDIGAVDDKPDQQAKRIGDDVPFAALHPLAGIKASDTAAFGSLDALAVDDASGRARLVALQLARRHGEMAADLAQQTAVAPVVEIALDCRVSARCSTTTRLLPSVWAMTRIA